MFYECFVHTDDTHDKWTLNANHSHKVCERGIVPMMNVVQQPTISSRAMGNVLQQTVWRHILNRIVNAIACNSSDDPIYFVETDLFLVRLDQLTLNLNFENEFVITIFLKFSFLSFFHCRWVFKLQTKEIQIFKRPSEAVSCCRCENKNGSIRDSSCFWCVCTMRTFEYNWPIKPFPTDEISDRKSNNYVIRMRWCAVTVTCYDFVFSSTTSFPMEAEKQFPISVRMV